uniref:Uncharacterized protein n=1 Tax=Macaca fascicularis TaxID=9541 RepID=Q9MZZ0_MACFA|nr:hypothetical protein [Macaca fascicularis]
MEGGCPCFSVWTSNIVAMNFYFGPEFPPSSVFRNMHYYVPNTFLACTICQLFTTLIKLEYTYKATQT